MGTHCLFLKQNPNWTATGVVVDIRGDKALFMMPDIDWHVDKGNAFEIFEQLYYLEIH
jgi:hypothetical protein